MAQVSKSCQVDDVDNIHHVIRVFLVWDLGHELYLVSEAVWTAIHRWSEDGARSGAVAGVYVGR